MSRANDVRKLKIFKQIFFINRDPRQRRLAEQQKQKNDSPVPEKLSFKEKMKMFALESGENQTPKDKLKISRAQRDIDAVH
jgi:afadin